MEKVTHLWNVNKFLSNFECPQHNKLHAFYIQCCRSLSYKVDLPRKDFGPHVMCSHCGCLWTNTAHNIRIIRAKKPPSSLTSIINSLTTSQRKMPKVRRTLIQKCMKNQVNKIQITCSFCSLKTELPLKKPPRFNVKKNKKVQEGLQECQKKKKKKNDKTAGIIISRNSTNCSNAPMVQPTLSVNFKKTKTGLQTPKVKKLRLDKLKDIVSQVALPKGKKSLHNFLAELI